MTPLNESSALGNVDRNGFRPATMGNELAEAARPVVPEKAGEDLAVSRTEKETEATVNIKGKNKAKRPVSPGESPVVREQEDHEWGKTIKHLMDINERSDGDILSNEGLWVLLAHGFDTYDRYVQDIDKRSAGNKAIQRALYRLFTEGKLDPKIQTAFIITKHGEKQQPTNGTIRSTNAYDEFVEKVDAAADESTKQALYESLLNKEEKAVSGGYLEKTAEPWWKRMVSKVAPQFFASGEIHDQKIDQILKKATEDFQKIGFSFGDEVEYGGEKWQIMKITVLDLSNDKSPVPLLRLIKKSSLAKWSAVAQESLLTRENHAIPKERIKSSFITTLSLDQIKGSPGLIKKVVPTAVE